MSLDVTLSAVRMVEVYSSNITHNLNKMATAAGIYEAVWRPEEIGIATASQVIPILKAGIEKMKADPEFFKTYDADNGWGTYDQFVPWLEKYMAACELNPDAEVSASR